MIFLRITTFLAAFLVVSETQAKPLSTSTTVSGDVTKPEKTPDKTRGTVDKQRLVSGAPLYNPNVAVHIIEEKVFSDVRKREIVIFPVALQANGKFTQHYGSFGSFVWHLQENFGLQVTAGYNWYSAESSFNRELVEKVRTEAQAATSLLWTWVALAGVEVTPMYAKFALFESTLATFSVIITGGVGAGGTRHQLKAENLQDDGTISPATYGDTGVRFMGSIGAGFRLLLGKRFAFRLEVRDVVYTAKVDTVNGCNADDLTVLDTRQRAGQQLALADVSNRCNVGGFTGTIPGTEYKRGNDIPLSLSLVRNPTSDALNNVGVYFGAAILF